MLKTLFADWRLLTAKNPATLLVLGSGTILIIGILYVLFSKNDAPPKNLIVQKTVEIVQQEKSRDSLIQVVVIQKKNIIIDSLKFLIQKQHEEDSITRNHKLTELEAMRAINKSLRLNGFYNNGK